MDEVKQDIKDIKGTLVELVKQGAVHNSVLMEHQRRSLALESLREKDKAELDGRLKPIENHVRDVSWLLKTGGAITMGILVGVAGKYILALIL